MRFWPPHWTGDVKKTANRTLAALAGMMLATGGAYQATKGRAGLTEQERASLQRTYHAMKYREGWKRKSDERADSILRERAKYEAVQKATGVPWFAVGILDELEAGGGAKRHLHNGDSLQARTIHEPKGRPKDGEPPFTWYASALDALSGHAPEERERWDTPDLLDFFEEWNGLGYRDKGRVSPYVWSGSDYWSRGKYTSDGVYDPNATSDQVGAALLLASLTEKGAVWKKR